MIPFIVGFVCFSAIGLLVASLVLSINDPGEVSQEWLDSHGYSEGQRPRDL